MSSRQTTAAVSGVAGESDTAAERIEPYGLTSIPLPGHFGVEIELDSEGDARLLVQCGPMASADGRPALAAGEVALYTRTGSAVVLRVNGNIEIGEGATLAVARATDPVVPSAEMIAWMAAVAAAVAPAVLPPVTAFASIQSGSGVARCL